MIKNGQFFLELSSHILCEGLPLAQGLSESFSEKLNPLNETLKGTDKQKWAIGICPL